MTSLDGKSPGTQMVPMNWLRVTAKRFIFPSNSSQAILEAASRGKGDHPNTVSKTSRLDVDAELPRVPIYLVRHRELHQVPRVRLVADRLTAELRVQIRQHALMRRRPQRRTGTMIALFWAPYFSRR